VPSLIDEIPILAIVMAYAQGVSNVRGAGELRVKESDRIRAIVENLRRMGAKVEEYEDGFSIEGVTSLRGTLIKTYGDHRIAMGFARLRKAHMLRKFLFEDIQYKVVSLIVGLLLWSAVNFGTKTSLSVEREVELKNAQDNYIYKLSRKKVRIKVSFVERLISEGALENIQPFVDVRGLNTGRYLVKVEVRNPYKFLVSVDKVEPEKVEVIIQEAPKGGER
jgi:hypothetical protein